MAKTKSDQLRELSVGEKLHFKGANHQTVKSLASRIRALSGCKITFTVRKTDTGVTVWRLA